MCKVLAENEKESVKACITNEANPNLGKTLHQLEDLHGKVNQILTVPLSHSTLDRPATKDQQQLDESESDVQRSGQPSDSNPHVKVENIQATETKVKIESKPVSEDVEMVESAVDANADVRCPATDGSPQKGVEN